MTWRRIIRTAYVTPIALAILLIAGNFHFQTRIGSLPVRVQGLELIVWKYGRRWIEFDFGAMLLPLLTIEFLLMVAWLVAFLINRSAMRRQEGRHGFEVIPIESGTERQ